jgi:hypothetical protein
VTIVLLRHRESVWYCEEVKILPFKEADLDQGRSWVLDRGYANFGERCKAEVQLRRIHLPKLSEKPLRRLHVAQGAAIEGLCGPFWSPYAGENYARSFACTPFRTVSEVEFSEVRIEPQSNIPEASVEENMPCG